MRELLRDVRRSFRCLAKAPGFVAAAVAILALGTGVNVAMMGLIDHILLRPLSYPDSERLVAVFEHLPERGELRNPTSPATFGDWRQGSRALEHMTAARPWSPILRGAGQPVEIPALRATSDLFPMLGVKALLGRTVAAGDERVAVLGHQLWQRVFGGRSEVVGDTVSLDGEPFTVIGVMPPGFAFPPFWASDAELWAPLVLDAEAAAARGARYLRVFARLREGASIEQARGELGALSTVLAAEHPDLLGGVAARLEPMIEPVVGDVRSALWILFFAVGCVLLLAATNVSSLVMVRSLARLRDMAVRRALGAGRFRIVRLLLIESVILASLGTAAGLLLAWWLIDAVAALGSASLPRLDTFALETMALDGRVLAYAAIVAMVSVAAFGVAPALRLARDDLAHALRAGSRGMAAGAGRTRAVAVVAELAVAMVLLVGAGLMIGTLAELRSTDLGLRVDRALVVPMSFSGTVHESSEAQPALLEAIGSAAEAVPGVEAAALVNHAAIVGDLWRTPFVREGEAAPAAIEEKPKAAVRVISDRFFDAAGIALLAGRPFDARDRADSEPVVIVNRTLAARFFGPAGAVGGRLLLGAGDPETDAVTIVGVVSDTRQRRLRDATLPEIYHPYAQNPSPWWRSTTLVAHTAGSPERAAPALVAELRTAFPDLAIGAPRTMTEAVRSSLAETRFQTAALAGFSTLATLLAGLGVFGLISFLVRQRRDEIGLRIVVGARRRDIVALVIGGALRPVALGLAVGLISATALARGLAHLVYGIGVYDARAMLAAAAVLAVAALVAAVVPAWRASRVDPMTCLRIP